MAFDKAQFVKRLKAALEVALNPTFTPVPDSTIEDEERRNALHEGALARAGASRDAAVLDVLAKDLGYMVARTIATASPDARAALLSSASSIASSTSDEQALAALDGAVKAALGI